MIGPSYFYAPVYLKKEPACCWLINKSFKEKFDEALAYCRMAERSRTLDEVTSFEWSNDGQDASWTEISTSLSLISHLPDKTILTKSEFLSFAENKILAPTELFKHPQSTNSGSSRHAILGPLELKGIGRNCISAREDYFHTWGGMTKNDAILGFINGEILFALAPLGAWRTVMINEYSDYKTYYIARERPTVRSSFFSKDLWNSKSDKAALKNLIKLKQGDDSPKFILDQNLSQLKSSFLDQWVHLSPTFENFSIEGSLIDLESVFVPLEKTSGFPVMLNLKFHNESVKAKPRDKTSLISLLVNSEISSIHSLLSEYVRNQVYRMENYFHLFDQTLDKEKYFKELDRKLKPISLDLSKLVAKLAKSKLTKRDVVSLVKNHSIWIKDFIELPGQNYLLTLAVYMEGNNDFRETPIFSTQELTAKWMTFDDDKESNLNEAVHRFQQFKKIIDRRINL